MNYISDAAISIIHGFAVVAILLYASYIHNYVGGESLLGFCLVFSPELVVSSPLVKLFLFILFPSYVSCRAIIGDLTTS